MCFLGGGFFFLWLILLSGGCVVLSQHVAYSNANEVCKPIPYASFYDQFNWVLSSHTKYNGMLLYCVVWVCVCARVCLCTCVSAQ